MADRRYWHKTPIKTLGTELLTSFAGWQHFACVVTTQCWGNHVCHVWLHWERTHGRLLWTSPRLHHMPLFLHLFCSVSFIVINLACECIYMQSYWIIVNHWTWSCLKDPQHTALQVSVQIWHGLWGLSSLSQADFIDSLPLLLQVNSVSYCMIINCLHFMTPLKYKLLKDKHLIFPHSFFQHWCGGICSDNCSKISAVYYVLPVHDSKGTKGI